MSTSDHLDSTILKDVCVFGEKGANIDIFRIRVQNALEFRGLAKYLHTPPPEPNDPRALTTAELEERSLYDAKKEER